MSGLDKNEFFVCACHNFEHQFILIYDNDYNIIYMQIHLNTCNNIFKRIGIAIKYIFGYKSRFGEFDEFIISADDKERLLNEIIK